ncbi:unnamed protein product [Adineta steineri]|uniref:Nudix hydrolase domain-containing protein n=1 Tax=Adineta steineri TaxID=433720 RepID=A0A814QKX4_9BILA|nr:unnamed protein product [Adineta steineri]CAF4082022.1 unnamed protein product [Adineta steineri]
MPFDASGKYKLPKEFKKNLSRCLSKYLCPLKGEYSKKEYNAMLDKLCKIEETPVEDVVVIKKEDRLTFEARRDDLAQQMERRAIPMIKRILQKLYKKRDANSPLDDEGWTTKKPTEDKVAKDIWKLWTKECEQAPRCGIILLSLEKLDAPEVLLIMYYKNNDPHYGYPKGKIEIGESIRECAVREASEELGCTKESIDDNINDEEAILKNIEYIPGQPLIEHYYFIVPVVPKDMQFKLNKTEVNAIKWCNIYKLPCCQDCQVTQLEDYKEKGTSASYFMVTCYDKSNRESKTLVQDILKYMDGKDKNQPVSKKYDEQHTFCPGYCQNKTKY